MRSRPTGEFNKEGAENTLKVSRRVQSRGQACVDQSRSDLRQPVRRKGARQVQEISRMPSATGAGREPALALDRITCTFASRERAGDRYTAVRDTTIAVGEGEFVSVVGPTGCGKSTLLNVAAGLLAPSSGKVRVNGLAAGRHQSHRGLHVPGRLADAVAQRAGQCSGRAGIRRRSAGRCRNARPCLARARRPDGLRAPLSRTSFRAACASAWHWRRC